MAKRSRFCRSSLHSPLSLPPATTTAARLCFLWCTLEGWWEQATRGGWRGVASKMFVARTEKPLCSAVRGTKAIGHEESQDRGSEDQGCNWTLKRRATWITPSPVLQSTWRSVNNQGNLLIVSLFDFGARRVQRAEWHEARSFTRFEGTVDDPPFGGTPRTLPPSPKAAADSPRSQLSRHLLAAVPRRAAMPAPWWRRGTLPTFTFWWSGSGSNACCSLMMAEAFSSGGSAGGQQVEACGGVFRCDLCWQPSVAGGVNNCSQAAADQDGGSSSSRCWRTEYLRCPTKALVGALRRVAA